MDRPPAAIPGRSIARYNRILWTLALVIVLTLAAVGAYRALEKRVVLEVDGRTLDLAVLGRGVTVADALGAAEVELRPQDVVTPSLDRPLRDGLAIKVRRALPVRVAMGRGEWTVRTTSSSVAELLAELKVRLTPQVSVSPGPGTPLRPGMSVSIDRHDQRVVLVEQEIPFKVARQPSGALNKGEERVVQQGAPGLRRLAFRHVYRNGDMVESLPVGDDVVRAPREHIVTYGTGGSITRDGRTVEYSRDMVVVATAYSPDAVCTGPYADGYTSIGLRAGPGVVAVDPAVIPLRTRLYVEGYGYCTAGDIGGAIKGNRIDVCFSNYTQALSWGRRSVKVYVLR